MGKNNIFNFFFASRNALILCVLLYLAIPLNTFLSSPYPGGVDVATHLFQIGLIAEEGFTPWNHWWYGGIPLLEQYPPLSHLSGALISNMVGVETAYKIVFTLIFMLFPISFYLLLQEFDFKDGQKAFALYFFSLCPVYSYHMQGGVFSAMFAIPFAIIFLKFLARTLNSEKWLHPAVLASIFLAVAALSHLLIPVIAGLFGFIYLVSFKPSIGSLKRLALIGFLSFCLVAFFWVPLALNYTVRGDSLGLSSLSIPEMATTALAPIGRAFAVYINYTSILLLAALAAATLLSLYSSYTQGRRNHLCFFILSISAMLVWILFLPHSGQAGGKLSLVLPAVFAIFLGSNFSSKGIHVSARFLQPDFCNCKNGRTFPEGKVAQQKGAPFSSGKIRAETTGRNPRISAILFPLSILVLALLFISLAIVKPSGVSEHTYQLAEWAAQNTEGRALFLPQGLGLLDPFDSKANSDTFLYETYLFPHYFGREIYNGWFFEAEPRPDILEITFSCGHRWSAGELLAQASPFSRTIFSVLTDYCKPLSSPERFCEVITEGSVGTVFANGNFPNATAFAEGAPCLSREGSFGPLTAYRVEGSQPYVDGNLDYTKKSGTISITVEGPYHGNLTVRESYYPSWKATAGGQGVPVHRSGYGFLSVPLDLGAGSHELKLEYVPNNYYGLFSALSLLAWVSIAAYILFPAAFGRIPSAVEKLA